MRDFEVAFALALVIEGLLYAAFPGSMRRAIEVALAMPPVRLRIAGLAIAALGVVLVWAFRR